MPQGEIERLVAETIAEWRRRPDFFDALKFKNAEEVAAFVIKAATDGQLWKNDLYTVCVYDDGDTHRAPSWPALVHLSIKRNDREPIHDWRDLQQIKNEIVGADCEGVELYPAESRRVDSANQYHLFVIKEPRLRFPFGFTDRFVTDDVGTSRAKQRQGSGGK
jgi:hypothetical protein